jgi:hypothetical protein
MSFVSKVKKLDKVDGPDVDKSEWIKLEFLINPYNPESGSKYSRQLAIFKDGCRVQEDWIKWVMAFCEIEKGQALSYFEHHLMRMLEAEDSDIMLGKYFYDSNISIMLHPYLTYKIQF